MRLPLLTKRERRNLNGFWWLSVTAHSGHKDVDLNTRIRHSWIVEEFADAIDWLEEMKA